MAPYLLLVLLLGAAYGTLFHLWRGRSWHDLILYFLTGILGFALGQLAGSLIDLELFLIGPLHVVLATITSWASLFLVQWLKI